MEGLSWLRKPAVTVRILRLEVREDSLEPRERLPRRHPHVPR